MKQYCRYCAFCCYGDVAYCTEFDRPMSDAQIKRANQCERFALSGLGDVETGRQYQPREERFDDGQINGQMRMEL
ncbi:MAG: hypothetical protein IKP40_13960 [Clostridia bacterium]|nr:hypothetical protein [Clostridia bacterium]